MATTDTCCSIAPYFEVADGRLPDFHRLCEQFVQLTLNEPGCLYYGFCFDGNLVHCREGYRDADAALAHLGNVGETLGEALKISKLVRLEIHGPASELAKLRGPLASLPAQFLALEHGFRR
jgi:hypothetical protein